MYCNYLLLGSLVSHFKLASAQSTLSPDAALQALLDGSAPFVRKQLASRSEDLAIIKQNAVTSKSLLPQFCLVLTPVYQWSLCSIKALGRFS